MQRDMQQARWADEPSNNGRPVVPTPRRRPYPSGETMGPPTLLAPPPVADGEEKPTIPFDALSNALLLVDKPRGWTSFDVCNSIRRAATPNFSFGRTPKNKLAKVGHAGTLDPLATGLMLVCVGAATKSVSGYSSLDKAYVGSMRLGQTTPSLDCDTPVDAEKPWEHIGVDNVKECLTKNFDGDIMQVPPMYSAKSQGGERLYDKARRGETVKREPCKVTINAVDAWSVGERDGDMDVYNAGGDAPPADAEDTPDDDGDDVDSEQKRISALPISAPTARDVMFSVDSSKGTYVRSVVDDAGRLLGCGAYMTSLRRTRVGPYEVSAAWNVDDLVDALWDAKRAAFPKPEGRRGNVGGRGRGGGRGGRGGRGRGGRGRGRGADASSSSSTTTNKQSQDKSRGPSIDEVINTLKDDDL